MTAIDSTLNSTESKFSTIDTRLIAAQGRPAGFDYMRLVLAIAVIAMHSVIIASGWRADLEQWNSPARPVLRSILPMFFALSGFLVAGSFERSRTVAMFFGLRVIRIYPALVVEVILSAFLLGTVFTTLSLGGYFAHPTFHVYLLNMLGEPHYELPGVFLDNPNPGQVNRQLWTVPYELACYASLALISLAGGRTMRYFAPLVAALLTVAYIVGRHIKYAGDVPETVGPLGGPLLVICFLVGVGLFSYRRELKMNGALGAGALLAGFACVSVVPGGDFVAPWFLGYATVYLGTMNPKRIILLVGADYSYGLFLYGYPIQQALVALIPGQTPLVNTVMATIVAAMFAGVSWHLIEKPALRLRKPMQRAENRHLAARAAKQGEADSGLAARRLD